MRVTEAACLVHGPFCHHLEEDPRQGFPITSCMGPFSQNCMESGAGFEGLLIFLGLPLKTPLEARTLEF